jgi:hypothetical protein
MRTPKMTLAEVLREINVAPHLEDRLARTVFNLGGGRMPTVFTIAALANANLATETLIAITPPLNPGIDAAMILLVWMWGTNAVGATGTSVQLRIRQGTTAVGAAVGQSPVNTVVAGNAFSGITFGFDTPGAVAGQQYNGTVLVGAATANTVSNIATMLAMAIG